MIISKGTSGRPCSWGEQTAAEENKSRKFPAVVLFLQLNNTVIDMLGHYATSRKVAGAMALGSTQPLPEMSTRERPGGKGRPERKVDNLTAICEPIV
jgi:hypothetical protein